MSESLEHQKIMDYIARHPAGVLSTINEDGSPHGAVVYVCSVSHKRVCFITKTLTQKYANLTKRPQVSFTFFSEQESNTLQTNGRAFVVSDPQVIEIALQKIAKVHAAEADWLPPLAKIRAGAYVVVGVDLAGARLAEYQNVRIGSDEIFTQI